MRLLVITSFCFLLLLSSCGTTGSVSHPGMGRVRQYDFYHQDIPVSFDGFRIAFASDFHYKSRFKEKQLDGLVKTLNSLDADVLLMGGDYQEGCEYVPELAARLGEVKTRFGAIGVMGNNDYERCYDEIITEMNRHGIRMLEHANDTLTLGNDRIIISGVRNPFDLKKNGISPTLTLKPEDFVILLTHTPDYVEDVDISNTDLALAGHTHGGQVTFFGLFAPETGSHYGKRFLTGKKQNSQGIPVIITNGLGTSRRNIRMFAPSEVVMVILHREEKGK